jgi:hypothetical protein
MKWNTPLPLPSAFRQPYSLRITTWVVMATYGALLGIRGTAFSATPRGVFSIASTGLKIQDPVLTASYVDGISLRQDWSDLQPIESFYNFTYLDTEIGRASAAGKPVLLRIMTMAGRPKWVDTAVKQARGKFFSWLNNGVNVRIPVPWDPTFLAKKTAMITALGNHFGTNPNVIIVCASVANCVTEDWNMIHTSDAVVQWQRLGYTTQIMRDAGALVIATTMNAFPLASVTMAVAGNGNQLDGPGGDQVLARDIIGDARAAWGSRMIVQKNDLSVCIPASPGTGSFYEVMWDFRPDSAGQMLSSIYNDTSHKVSCGDLLMLPDVQITTSVTAAVAYGEKYVEVYEGDVVRYSLGCTTAHNLLLAAP